MKAIVGILVATIILLIAVVPPANASLCQKIGVSFAYPRQAAEGQPVPVSATVAGSCVSDGEDYFAVRVDLIDNSTGATLSSNSSPIGYNANNFSIVVNNTVVAPKTNQSWPVTIDAYLIQAGALSGRYLLNATTITIQVGDTPLPEIPFNPTLALVMVLMAASCLLMWKKRPENQLGR